MMVWIKLWSVMMLMTAAVASDDPASNQIVTFMEKTSGPVGVLSTSGGVKIDNSTANTSLNKKLIRNQFFMESITHLVRERIPERSVHAKGAGAFGYFEVTHDLSDICKAKVFSEVGKKTPIAVRFSLVSIETGGMDNFREPRGFAVKFYTEDGNFDIVGLNTPMFPIKDPLLFPTFVRMQKRNPATNLKDPNMLWDFITLNPESLNTFLLVFSDRGVPYGYRYMPGFGIHTFQVVNEHGHVNFVRFHFKPDAGIKNLRSDDAINIGGIDPDYAIRDLHNAIANGNYPSWSVGVQVLTMEDVKTAGFNVFDATRELPLDKYPLRMVGRFVLNKNPSNVFAEVEQIAFCPGNLVPGILGGPDKLFESRILSYRDAQNYRLGANFNKIKVNKPIKEPYTYNRDGVPPVDENEWGIPNYYPNSFNGPQPYIEKNKVDIIDIHEEPADNFDQISARYVNEFTDDERDRLINNIVTSLGSTTRILQERAVGLFRIIHPDLSRRVWEGLQSNRTTYYNVVPLV